MNKLDLEKFNWYGFKHSEVLKQFNQSKYVGTFCLKGSYKPYAIYHAESPDLDKGHKSFIGLNPEYIVGFDQEEIEKERYQEGIQCESCDDVIYSVMRHDFRPCKCGKVAIDGGRDYTKVIFEPEANYKMVKIDLLEGTYE